MQCSKNAQSSVDSKYIIFQKNDENFAYSTNTITSIIFIYIYVGSLPQLIGFIRFGEPVPHGLSARPRVWAGPTKG